MASILYSSAKLYASNPLLAVPPSLLFAVNLVVLLVSKPQSQVEVANPLLLQLGLGFTSILALASFFVVIGLAGMSTKAVEGKGVRLRDWRPKSWRHVFTILGLSIVYLVVVFSLFTAIGLSFVLLFIQGRSSYSVTISPSSLEEFVPGMANAFRIVSAFIFSLAQTFLFLWVASAVIDDSRAPKALELGVGRFRKGKRDIWLVVFFSFLVFSIPPSVESLAESPVSQKLFGSVSLFTLLSQLAVNMTLPFWFLMAFQIYKRKGNS